MSDDAHDLTLNRFVKQFVVASLAIFLLAGLLFLGVRTLIVSDGDQAIRRAENYVVAGDTRSARAALKWLLWFEPNNPQALIAQGRVEGIDGNYAAAIECLERVPHANDADGNARLLMAAALASDGQYEAAESELNQHAERHSNSQRANDQLATLFVDQLRLREAVHLLEQRLTSADDGLLILQQILKIEFTPPDPLERLPQLQIALQKHPGQATVELALGLCLVRSGRLPETEQLFRQSYGRRPEHGETCFALAELLIGQDEVDEAEQILWRQGDQAPNSVTDKRLLRDDRYWSLSSRLYETRGELDEAMSCLNRAMSLRVGHSDHLSQRVRLLRQISRKNEAVQVLKVLKQNQIAARELRILAERLQSGRRPLSELKRVSQLYRQLGRRERADVWDRLIAAEE